MVPARDEPEVAGLLALAALETDRPTAMIRRRRRQILVHSAIYYRAGTSLVSDAVYDMWCRELQVLQTFFPKEARQVEYAKVFHGFDGTTGFNLPIDDACVTTAASRLVEYAQRPDVSEDPRS